MTHRDALPQIERLARVLRWGPTGASTFEGRGATGRLGRAGEFEEYRPWRSGEDLRSIDVRVYRRLRRRVARVDREDAGQPLTVLIDRSASMDDPEREDCVRGLAMFFVALAHAHGEAHRAFTFQRGSVHPLSAADPTQLDLALDAVPLAGGNDFRRAFAALPIDPHGRGRIVVLSDGFGLEEETDLGPLTQQGRVLWLAPLTREERTPAPIGAVALESREDEPVWHGVIDEETVSRYRDRLAARWTRIGEFVRARGGDAHLVAAELGWSGAITACLERGRWLRR